jgi:hypothetical protein
VLKILGFSAAAAVMFALTEGYLRLSPPSEYEPYLGDASARRGPFVAGGGFGVAYRSFDHFVAANDGRLRAFLPLSAPGAPLWALFGNSFVQAPGMLGDTVRDRVRDRRIFFLGRNEDLFVRFAQIALLLEHGLRPERIFVTLMPTDLIGLGAQPLATLQISDGGAIGYRPRLPGGAAGWVVARSAVARTAWFRAGRHRGNPSFDQRRVTDHLDDPLLGDLRRLFGALAEVAHASGVPVTVLLIPTYQQVLHGASYAFQSTLTPLLTEMGFDVCDPRDAFAAAASPSLFAADWHFSPAGNGLLAEALLAHLRRGGALAAATPPAR